MSEVEKQSRRTFEGKIVDVLNTRMFPGRVYVEHGRIAAITECHTTESRIISPGLVNSHIHVESSMLPPREFARLDACNGTVATVSDPHEIANVCGIDGVRWMLENAREAAIKINLGAPPCVPATSPHFETSGAVFGVSEVEELLNLPDIRFLSEVMNFPGVLNGDPALLAMIEHARKLGKQVDGHAPGLRGEQARKYIAAGITTDHECFTCDEALDKLGFGMKILIREGSAAKNFDALADLLNEHSDHMMLCSDDKHPNDLVRGHLDGLVRRAIEAGIDPYKVLKAASINPVRHYNLPVGTLRQGDPADFIVVDNLQSFNVLETYIHGVMVARAGTPVSSYVPSGTINRFSRTPIEPDEISLRMQGSTLRVIDIVPGQLITGESFSHAVECHGQAVSDPAHDVLKVVVVNRYSADSRPSVAFVRNLGLKDGAIASSVAHDSHNIVAVGVSDADITRAINLVISAGGGVSLADRNRELLLRLPIGGLVSDSDGFEVARIYDGIDQAARELGSSLPSPFMSLSFLALPVIPSLKVTDKGLFDVNQFKFVPVFA